MAKVPEKKTTITRAKTKNVETYSGNKLVSEKTAEGKSVARINIVQSKSGKGISKSKGGSDLTSKEVSQSINVQKEQESVNQKLQGPIVLIKRGEMNKRVEGQVYDKGNIYGYKYVTSDVPKQRESKIKRAEQPAQPVNDYDIKTTFRESDRKKGFLEKTGDVVENIPIVGSLIRGVGNVYAGDSFRSQSGLSQAESLVTGRIDGKYRDPNKLSTKLELGSERLGETIGLYTMIGGAKNVNKPLNFLSKTKLAYQEGKNVILSNTGGKILSYVPNAKLATVLGKVGAPVVKTAVGVGESIALGEAGLQLGRQYTKIKLPEDEKVLFEKFLNSPESQTALQAGIKKGDEFRGQIKNTKILDISIPGTGFIKKTALSIPGTGALPKQKENFKQGVKEYLLSQGYNEKNAELISKSASKYYASGEIGSIAGVLGQNILSESIGRSALISTFKKLPVTSKPGTWKYAGEVALKGFNVFGPAGAAEGAGGVYVTQRQRYEKINPYNVLLGGVAGAGSAALIGTPIIAAFAKKPKSFIGKALQYGSYVADPYESPGDAGEKILRTILKRDIGSTQFVDDAIKFKPSIGDDLTKSTLSKELKQTLPKNIKVFTPVSEIGTQSFNTPMLSSSPTTTTSNVETPTAKISAFDISSNVLPTQQPIDNNIKDITPSEPVFPTDVENTINFYTNTNTNTNIPESIQSNINTNINTKTNINPNVPVNVADDFGLLPLGLIPPGLIGGFGKKRNAYSWLVSNKIYNPASDFYSKGIKVKGAKVGNEKYISNNKIRMPIYKNTPLNNQRNLVESRKTTTQRMNNNLRAQGMNNKIRYGNYNNQVETYNYAQKNILDLIDKKNKKNKKNKNNKKIKDLI